jgi:hypothetical protein
MGFDHWGQLWSNPHHSLIVWFVHVDLHTTPVSNIAASKQTTSMPRV